MISKQEADEKVNQGWIRTWMMFEVLAVNEEVTRNSLESLMNKLENDERIKLYKKEFGKIDKVENPPFKDIETAYSLTCEIELISKRLDNLVQIVTEYGPSAIEIFEPKELKVEAGEAQSILNSIAQVMHQFAAAGAGGIVFIKEKK
ncbi:MAG: hypothetical protein ACE5J4_01025 [Candidatus Aenigmatarchaeota archaeon]